MLAKVVFFDRIWFLFVFRESCFRKDKRSNSRCFGKSDVESVCATVLVFLLGSRKIKCKIFVNKLLIHINFYTF